MWRKKFNRLGKAKMKRSQPERNREDPKENWVDGEINRQYAVWFSWSRRYIGRINTNGNLLYEHDINNEMSTVLFIVFVRKHVYGIVTS